MRTLIRVVVGMLLAVPLALAQDGGQVVSFLACPIARDAGPDVDLCFVADYQGERIALSNPPDFGAPQLHHQVLVEGTVRAEPGSCGGRKFEGRISVMRELASECDTVLPYDGSFKGVAGGVFNSGSPAQRAHAQRLADRIATDPKASLEPAILDPPVAPAPTPPFQPQDLVLLYPFGSTRASGPDMLKLKLLVDYARAAHAHAVTVTAYRAESRLADGRVLTEAEPLAQARADLVSAVLVRLGVDAKRVSVRAETQAVPGDGHEDWRHRRVDIHLDP